VIDPQILLKSQSKDIFVQVILKIFRFESPLKGSSDQSFDQGRHQVDAIELIVIPGLGLVGYFAAELFFVNDVVAWPVIRSNGCARFDIIENEVLRFSMKLQYAEF